MRTASVGWILGALRSVGDPNILEQDSVDHHCDEQIDVIPLPSFQEADRVLRLFPLGNSADPLSLVARCKAQKR